LISDNYSYRLTTIKITGSFQQTLYAARIDLADVRGRFNRKTVAEAFDNANHGRCGQLGIYHE
jgi:hypothetical protein